jgi:hypothetical protein
MAHQYTHPPQPDPAQAACEQEFVRARLRRASPVYAQAVDSVVDADMPLEQAVRDLRNARNRVRVARNSRSRAARLCTRADWPRWGRRRWSSR